VGAVVGIWYENQWGGVRKPYYEVRIDYKDGRRRSGRPTGQMRCIIEMYYQGQIEILF